MSTHSEPHGASSFVGGVRSRGVPVFMMCALSLGMVGCGLFTSHPKPTTLGETVSGYTYVPIDPTKVKIIGEGGKECPTSSDIQKKLLDMLPDNAVRMSMESSDTYGNVTYGVSKVGTTGSAYRLTADYVNSDTVNTSVWIKRTVQVRNTQITYDDNGKVLERKEGTERVVFPAEEALVTEIKGGKTKQVRELRLIHRAGRWQQTVGRPSGGFG